MTKEDLAISQRDLRTHQLQMERKLNIIDENAKQEKEHLQHKFLQEANLLMWEEINHMDIQYEYRWGVHNEERGRTTNWNEARPHIFAEGAISGWWCERRIIGPRQRMTKEGEWHDVEERKK